MNKAPEGEALSRINTRQHNHLRVALVAGTLSKGGAEKQLVYMAHALQQAGVEVRIYCLTKGEYHEDALAGTGLAPIWIGQSGSPISRLWRLYRTAREFRPHILQSTHFYTNLYVALVARMLHVLSIGAIRSSMVREVRANGMWSRWLLRLPSALIANSHPARDRAVKAGYPPEQIEVLQNVIDLDGFDQSVRSGEKPLSATDGKREVRAAIVARLVKIKRHDRFLRALAHARKKQPQLRGVIIGGGPLLPELEALAEQLGLLPDGVTFLGERTDVPAILNQCDMLVLTSDEEGFPNAILEGMAACLPVITTPAGQAPAVVEEGITGYVIPFDDEEILGWQMARIASRLDLRIELGKAARHRVEESYSFITLAGRLLKLYQKFSIHHRRDDIAARAAWHLSQGQQPKDYTAQVHEVALGKESIHG